MKQIVVIGGGASGMMAAIHAAKEGAQVTLIEHGTHLGKKILSTGNGKCNFTNIYQELDCYHSSNPEFPSTCLNRFSTPDTISFFLDIGIYSKNKNGYLYPYSEQASSVCEALVTQLKDFHVHIILAEEIVEIKKQKKQFFLWGKNSRYQADAVILAAGSKASVLKEADGSGYALAEKMGHNVIKPLPALVQLRSKEGFFKKLAGIRIYGKVTLYSDEQEISSDCGELQLTKYGISGIPVFQVSRYAAKALAEGKEVCAIIDFMPDFEPDAFCSFLKKRAKMQNKHTLEQFFNGLYPSGLSKVIIYCMHCKGTTLVCELTERDWDNMVLLLKSFRTTIIGTNGFEQAQVCAGGVDTTNVNPDSLESLIVPGLYFAGEILDVDGRCGGYNLQWAWSSGYVAGREAANASN